MNNPSKLKKMSENSMEYLKELSWEKTTDEFVEILDRVNGRKGD